MGQRVIAFPMDGSYAEYARADQMLTFPIPRFLGFTHCGCLSYSFFTSYNLLAEVANIQKGESVLIHAAAGGIATTASQLAKLLGAKLVIGTVSSDEKKVAAQQAGVDYVINYHKENFADKVLEITEGRGVDIVLDSLAGDIFNKSLECLAKFEEL